MTLANRHGTITLAIEGPSFDVRKNGTVPDLTFQVANTTGAYAISPSDYVGFATLVLHDIRANGPVPRTGLPGRFLLKLELGGYPTPP